MTKQKSSDPLKLMLAEMARVLDADFSADKPLSFPREDMAVEISGDWGGSIQQACDVMTANPILHRDIHTHG